MPAPLELTNRRFGRLAVESLVLGESRRMWRCRCDCGGYTVVEGSRLSRSDKDSRAVRACEACRSKPCVVCGAPHLTQGSGVTCGKMTCQAIYSEMKRAILSDSSRVIKVVRLQGDATPVELPAAVVAGLDALRHDGETRTEAMARLVVSALTAIP